MNQTETIERAEQDIAAHIEHHARRAALALPVSRTAAGHPVTHTHCTRCRQPIPRERRAALPGATLCVGCSSQRDACSPAPRHWTPATRLNSHAVTA